MSQLPNQNCEEFQAQLIEFALDELPDSTAQPVADHLATGCPVCNARLAELVESLSLVAAGQQREWPPLRIEQELMRRVSGKPVAHDRPTNFAERRSTELVARRNFWSPRGWAIAASVAAAATWLTWSAGWWSQGEASLVSEAEFRNQLQQRLERAQHSQDLSKIPELSFVHVKEPAATEPVHGYVVADGIARQWHVYIFGLPAISDDKRYQLWIFTKDDRYLPVATIRPDRDGTSTNLIDMPADASEAVGVAISEEPASGSLQPTQENLIQARMEISPVASSK